MLFKTEMKEKYMKNCFKNTVKFKLISLFFTMEKMWSIQSFDKGFNENKRNFSN